MGRSGRWSSVHECRFIDGGDNGTWRETQTFILLADQPTVPPDPTWFPVSWQTDITLDETWTGNYCPDAELTTTIRGRTGSDNVRHGFLQITENNGVLTATPVEIPSYEGLTVTTVEKGPTCDEHDQNANDTSHNTVYCEMFNLVTLQLTGSTTKPDNPRGHVGAAYWLAGQTATARMSLTWNLTRS